MKKRTFYVINLDRSRILVLGLLFLGFILTAYATGYRVGQKPGSVDLERPRDMETHSMSDTGDSIYSKREDDTRKDEPGLPDREEKSDRSADDRIDLSRRFPETPKPGKMPVLREESGRQEKGRVNKPTHKTQTETAHREKPKRKKEKIEKTEKKETAKVSKPEEKDIPKTKEPLKKDTLEEKKETARKTETKETKNPKSALLDPKETKMSNVSEESKDGKKEERKAPSKTEEPAGRRFALQVGSFQTKAAADRMIDSLKHQGFDAHLQRSGGNFAVRVGRPGRPADLEKTEQNLKKKKFAPVRVAVTGG